ncbi:MAG: BON domain-containing protein [Acidobacteria bacterium]|nr:BON domain-containing protein [Acidobacteriota bacterium]MYI74734.1 BON domain-containing protein [Acidobacteriota bacterium]
MRSLINPAAVVACVASFTLLADRPAEAGQTSPGLEREVRESVHDVRDLRHIEVSVDGSEATLTGIVESFWDKHRAIQRALDVDGIETVVSELELPERESDNDIAEELSRQVQRYPHYTIWDFITGNVNEGNVVLGGFVTPDRDKSGDLFERVAKIDGVQDVRNEIQILSPSQGDNRLRRSIIRQLARSTHFERLVMMPNPPFHIVINNGIVLLVGYVQGQIELLEMQRIVAQTQGVLRVENQLQKLR